MHQITGSQQFKMARCIDLIRILILLLVLLFFTSKGKNGTCQPSIDYHRDRSTGSGKNASGSDFGACKNCSAIELMNDTTRQDSTSILPNALDKRPILNALTRQSKEIDKPKVNNSKYFNFESFIIKGLSTTTNKGKDLPTKRAIFGIYGKTLWRHKRLCAIRGKSKMFSFGLPCWFKFNLSRRKTSRDRKVLSDLNRTKVSAGPNNLLFPNQLADPKSRVKRSSKIAKESIYDGDSDDASKTEYEDIYEYDDDYENLAYTPLTTTTTTPTTSFPPSRMDLYDEIYWKGPEEEYVVPSNFVSDKKKGVDGRLMSPVKQPLNPKPKPSDKTVSLDTNGPRKKDHSETGNIPLTTALKFEKDVLEDIPEYFLYYDDYDYSYEDDALDKLKNKKAVKNTEETMEEVYFLSTVENLKDLRHVDHSASRITTTNSSASRKSTKSHSSTFTIENATKTNFSGISDSSASTTKVTEFPAGFFMESYYDSNYDDHIFDDEIYEYAVDPLLDQNFKKLIMNLNLTQKNESKNAYMTSKPAQNESSTDEDKNISSFTPEPSDFVLNPGNKRSESSDKTPPKSVKRRKTIHDLYYDELLGSTYYWEYDYDNENPQQDLSDRDYSDKNNTAFGKNWFSKVEKDGLSYIMPGLEILNKSQGNYEASYNAHVLDSKPFQAEIRQVCYLTGGIATENFLKIDRDKSTLRHFKHLPCTHLIIGMGRVTDNTLRNPSWAINKKREDIKKIVSLVKKAKSNLKILLAVGENKECPGYALKLWKTKESRQMFIESSTEILRDEDLDGIEFHFMRFDMTEPELKNLFDLVKETYVTFTSDAINMRLNKLLVSMATSKYLGKKLGTSVLKMKDFHRYLDFSNLVSHDLNDGDDTIVHDPPFTSDLIKMNHRVRHIIGHDVNPLIVTPDVKRRKGRTSPVTTPCSMKGYSGLTTYNQIFQFFGQPETSTHKNIKGSLSYLTDGKTWISFDNIMEKIQKTKDNDTDEFTIWGITFGNATDVPRFPSDLGNTTKWKLTRID